MPRRLIPASFALSVLLCTTCVSANVGAAKPNIVLLFVDDLGWNEVTYRRNALSIPNIDALIGDGMTFSRAYAASPTCSPSRASIITGKHPARLRMVRHIPDSRAAGPLKDEFHKYGPDPARMPSRNWLPVDAPSLAKALKPLGYRTAFVGKWHLGHDPYHPVKHGYDVQYGVSNLGHPHSYTAPFFGADSGTYEDVPEGKYLTEQLTDDAVAWLERQDEKQPFMLTLFYYSAHDPFEADSRVVERLRSKYPGKNITPLTAMLASVDDSVGRIRDALRSKGLASNTVIFFIGDQGGLSPNPPIRGNKRGGNALYDGGARVPFTVVWPGVATPKSNDDTLISTIDVFPTMLEMAGGEASDIPQLDGCSLTPILRGDGEIDRDAIVLYRAYEDQYAAVLKGNWKYIAYRRGRTELYDLASDISETNDLSEENPDKLAELKTALRAWEQQMDVPGELPK
jgi:arylsulfatase A-like enzyme